MISLARNDRARGRRSHGAGRPAGDRKGATAIKPDTRETILVCEDQEIVRRLVIRTLESAGYEVLEAGTGSQAANLARQSTDPIQLLFSDVMLPDMSGPQIAARVKEHHPDIQVLYATGFSAELVEEIGVPVGPSAVVEKPFHMSDLLIRVRATLDAGQRRSSSHGELGES